MRSSRANRRDFGWHHSPILSTERNASCGISTRPDRLHPLLAFFLLFQQLALAGDVAAVALGDNVLPHGGDTLRGDDFAADRRLELISNIWRGRISFSFSTSCLPRVIRFVPVRDERKRIHALAVDEDVHLDQLATACSRSARSRRRRSLWCATLSWSKKSIDDLGERQLVVRASRGPAPDTPSCRRCRAGRVHSSITVPT